MIKLERFRWTSKSPAIYVTYYYEYKRVDKDMYYRFQYVIEPVKGQSYFGYTIKTNIGLADTTPLENKTLKSASPSQWSNNITYTTSWFKVTNKTSGTTYAKIRLYSGGGEERDLAKTYYLPIVEYNASVGRIRVNGTYKESRPYVKVNGVWKETTKTYVKANGAWKETK